MKILHTADWHIGKKLHNYDLSEDFDHFIEWLCSCAQHERVDVLLVSGDCFDLANPSSAARNQYYESLVKLKEYVNQIVITGGNHDSPSVLNAPKELLKALNFDVIGGLPERLEDALVPLKNKQGNVEAVVAAIPFLRNPDLHKTDAEVTTYEQRLEVLREGISDVFKRAASACRDQYPRVPALAMGHLYAAGIELSESERDIQIGNQAAFQASAFDPYFKYLALGHIHKPQRVSAQQPVFYSGSPIPLSFSERRDDKRVLLLDSEQGWEPRSISIPHFRQLIRVSGQLDEIKARLSQLSEHQPPTDLIEVELHEDEYRSKLLHALEVMVGDFQKPGYEIVKYRAHFNNELKESGDIFEGKINLEELKPQKVFEERLNLEDFPEEERKELTAAFSELMEDE